MTSHRRLHSVTAPANYLAGAPGRVSSIEQASQLELVLHTMDLCEQFSTDVHLDAEDQLDLEKEEKGVTRGAPKLKISNASKKTISIQIAEIATKQQDVPLAGKVAELVVSAEAGGGAAEGHAALNVKVKMGETTFTEDKLPEMMDTVAPHGTKDIPLPGKGEISILRPAMAGRIHNTMTMKLYDVTDRANQKEIGRYMFGEGHAFIIQELGPDGQLAVYESRKRSFLKRFDRWLPKNKNMATLDPHESLEERATCKTCFMKKE